MSLLLRRDIELSDFNQIITHKDAFIKASKGIYDQFASEVPTGGALVKKVSSLAN